MARVSHPCVEIEGCGYAAFTETDPLHPQFGKLILTEKIDPDPCNVLECRPSGLFVPGRADPEQFPPIVMNASGTAIDPGSPTVLVATATVNETRGQCGPAFARITSTVTGCLGVSNNYGAGSVVLVVPSFLIGATGGSPGTVAIVSKPGPSDGSCTSFSPLSWILTGLVNPSLTAIQATIEVRLLASFAWPSTNLTSTCNVTLTVAVEIL
jgi:hypothetical protein